MIFFSSGSVIATLNAASITTLSGSSGLVLGRTAPLYFVWTVGNAPNLKYVSGQVG